MTWRLLLLALRALSVGALLIVAMHQGWWLSTMLSIIAGIMGADFIIQSELRREVSDARSKAMLIHACALEALELIAKDVKEKEAEAEHYRRLYLKKVGEQ